MNKSFFSHQFTINILLTLFYIVLGISKLSAQKNDLATWSVLNIKYDLSEKWSLFGESQIRSFKFFDNFQYYEYKVGGNYLINKNVIVTLGAGSYQTFADVGNFSLPKSNDEFRVWPQIILFESLGKIKLEQRFRYDLRFTSNGYLNRYRYRLSLLYPFGKEKYNYKPFQISASSELFFTNTPPYFERNRAALSFSYKPSISTSLQIGYLHQFDYKINAGLGRDYLQMIYSIEIVEVKK